MLAVLGTDGVHEVDEVAKVTAMEMVLELVLVVEDGQALLTDLPIGEGQGRLNGFAAFRMSAGNKQSSSCDTYLCSWLQALGSMICSVEIKANP